MAKNRPPVDVQKNLQLALFKSLIIPVLLLAFFIAAPSWLNGKIRGQVVEAINANSNLASYEKAERIDKFSKMDFQQVCLNCPPGLEKIHDKLEESGVASTFRRLRWGLILSAVLVAIMAVSIAAIIVLNKQAQKSQDDLIRSYRLSWKIGIAAALAKVFLLIPLLAYGTFEFTVLLSDQFFPKLLIVIILGGLFALWKSATVLLKKVPMEFKEPLCREVTAEEAPELWQAVKEAAQRLQTTPPDRILIGMQLNFYVSELAVIHDSGRVEGKTLFLSYPLLKQLSADEVLAIIGHELGHFIGEDTRMTREFYPMRLKVHATMIAMARSGWVGWPSFQFLNFFLLSFGRTEGTASRNRELLADQKAALLTSPQTAAHALLRFQVSLEAIKRGLTDSVKSNAPNTFDIPLQTVVQEKLASDSVFWTQLFEEKLPHPMDSHPSLQVRLESLQQNINAEDAKTIALAEYQTAYAKWFSGRDALFTNLAQQAEVMLGKIRTRTQVAQADYKTQEGKELLEKHFPEKKWRYKPSSFWAAVIVLGLLVAGCLAGVIFIPDGAAKFIFGLFLAGSGFVLTMVWKRHRRAEFVLTADGISYTGWKRPLHFTEVQNIAARLSYSNVILTFRLKEKQPPIWKFGLFPAKAVSFSLSGLDAKPRPTTETIYRYFARQAESK
jgi:Zn-dependent protease with chaperone function